MKIAIAGYGVEGKENYAYWAGNLANELTIVDERDELADLPDGAQTLLGAGAFQRLDGFDLVIRTAGLAPRKIATNGKVWSATNEFFAVCPAPIIGVTGSKGKGTTASLITSILEAAGKKVWLVGNIGVPALSVLPNIQPEDIVVYELSSFQLWDIEKSPHVAVVLHIEPDHLDVHASMEEYVQAKGNITRFQTEADVLVFNDRNEFSKAIAAGSSARTIGFPSDTEAHIENETFFYGPTAICSVGELRIPGMHNWMNAGMAIAAAWEYTQDTQAIIQGLNNFKGLPHRLAYVNTVNGVEFYDDSIATTPGSAVAALQAFWNRDKVIILGGSHKGSDFTALATEIKQHHATALLIGDEATRIAEAFTAAGFTQFEMVSGGMEDIVKRAYELAGPGDVVLLSPSAASFGMFKNYADRGDQFVAAVSHLLDN